MNDENWQLFATTPRGLEPLLADEICDLGGENIRTVRSGVSFVGNREMAYRLCLWSRVAGRVLLTLAEFEAETPEALYDGVQNVDWSLHLIPEGTLAVSCASVQSEISHTHFAALKVKDAIVDQFRDQTGIRPSVEVIRPDVRVNLYLFRNRATLSLDLSGESLHRRGYRSEGGGEAPLKEHLAAALLLRARWPDVAQAGGSLMDPMCGSGTFLIEGAMIAGDIAPGLSRSYFGFENWLQHDAFLWRDLVTEAHERREKGVQSLPAILGADLDTEAVALAKDNVSRAGLESVVQIEQKSVKQTRPDVEAGLIITNPPYGERVGQKDTVRRLYGQIGAILRDHFFGWSAAIFTGRPECIPALRLKPRRSYDFYNGTIACKLLVYRLKPVKNDNYPLES